MFVFGSSQRLLAAQGIGLLLTTRRRGSAGIDGCVHTGIVHDPLDRLSSRSVNRGNERQGQENALHGESFSCVRSPEYARRVSDVPPFAAECNWYG